MTIIVNLCRLVLALTFIVSGYVKSIDPLGTQYKLQDYLAAIDMAGIVSPWVTLAPQTCGKRVNHSLPPYCSPQWSSRSASSCSLPYAD